VADNVDWNALAAQVMANYEATGQWYAGTPSTPSSPPSSPPSEPTQTVDWNALAAQVMANYEATGQWSVGTPSTPPGSGSGTGSNPNPNPNPTPDPGFTVVLSDDFSNGYLQSHWGDPFPLPWPPGPSANGAYIWDPNDVQVRDGEMQITMTHHPDGHWSTSGFNSFKAGISITYGTVEFDAKVEHGQGTAGGILMWPADDTFPPEIDILETPMNQALFNVHWGDSNGSHHDPISSTAFDPSQWHHYKMTWLPDSLTIAVDGVVYAQWTSHIPDVPMSFGALGFVGSPWDGWMGGAPDSTTPSVVTLHLDNVVMSQWNGIA